MVAIGCLLPFVLLLAGAAVGGVLGGTQGGLWGGGAGLAIGLVGALTMVRSFSRARNQWPD